MRDFARRHGVTFWLQTGGPATVVPFDAPRRGARVPAAGVRHRDALCAHRFHAGQHGDQPRAGPARAGLARSAARRVRRRLLLRARQFHAADRPPRRSGAGRRGQRARSCSARRATRGTTGSRRAPASSSPTCSRRRRDSCGARALRPGADRSAARRRDRTRQVAAAPRRRRPGSADRLCLLRPGHARPRRVDSRARARLPAERPPAWSTCSRTPHTSSRSRCSNAESKENGAPRRPVSCVAEVSRAGR